MVNIAVGAHSRPGSRSSYPQESPRQVQLLYTEPCLFAYACAARLTQLQRSHSADSTTDRRSSSQLLPGAAGIPRVVALGMSSPVALVCRTRIRRQVPIYFCRHGGSLSEKTAGRQRDSVANRRHKNFRKKLYVGESRLSRWLHRLVRCS